MIEHSPRPSLAAAIAALRRVEASPTPSRSPDQARTLAEAIRRLERLEVAAQELTAINNELLDADRLTTDFDPDTDTMTFRAGDASISIRLRRANPDVPITSRSLGRGSGYDAAASSAFPEETQSLRSRLETGLEGFYASAHRVLKLLGKVPGLKGVRSLPVTIVRNHLVEHPTDGNHYSFGYGSGGAVVKPLQKNPRQWNDEGLVSNTRALDADIVAAVEKLLGSAT